MWITTTDLNIETFQFVILSVFFGRITKVITRVFYFIDKET